MQPHPASNCNINEKDVFLYSSAGYISRSGSTRATACLLNETTAIKHVDEIVFEKLYQTHYKKLFVYVFRKSSCHYISEEVVQITFIKLWRYRKAISPDIPLEAQIFRIAKTSLIDLLRKNAHQRRVIKNYKEMVAVEDENVMSALMRKELGKSIAILIEEMPRVRRNVFKLSREAGFSHREIAEQLSLTPKNVENHISKAMKNIRNTLSFAFFFCCSSVLLPSMVLGLSENVL
ncbi:MAG: sigma-70 family RNA polymerase sigma factor [Bacteroidota bacterium]